MGNECTEEDRIFRYSSFHEAIYAIEDDIKKEINNSDLSHKIYAPFGLVNQELYKKYKFLLNEKFDENEARKKIFNYKDLIKKNEKKDFTYINKKFSFSFPSKFIFITKDFLDVMKDYVDKSYKSHLYTVFNTIIGGDCLIMKNQGDVNDQQPYRYIILYSELKENLGNEIDFFLYIIDDKEKLAADNFILKYNLWNYFKSINYNYQDEYGQIYNKHKKLIGYVVRCSDINRIKNYISKIELRKQYIPKKSNEQTFIPQSSGQNQINQNTPSNFQAGQNNQNGQIPSLPGIDNLNKLKNYQTGQLAVDYSKLGQEMLLDAAISFFYQIDNLKFLLSQNKNLDIKTFKDIIMTKVQKNIKKFRKFENIFDEILTKIDPNNELNKEYYNQTIQYDEKKGLNSFLEKHEKGNIIQKLFLIPKEEKIYCNKCMMYSFQFIYRKYILIRNSQTELLFQKIFGVDKFKKVDKTCNFCNGQMTELIIEKKLIEYPEWLIVIIDPSQINSFQLGLNLFVSDGKFLSYNLFYFIEANTNFFYKINEQNTIYCNKFENNGFTNPHKLENKKPIVLFYHLTRNQINIQNIQNVQNQNNPIAMIQTNPQKMNAANMLPQQNAQGIQQNNSKNFQDVTTQKVLLQNQQNVTPNMNPQGNQPNPIMQNKGQNINTQNNYKVNSQQNQFQGVNPQNMNFNQNIQNNMNNQNLANFNCQNNMNNQMFNCVQTPMNKNNNNGMQITLNKSENKNKYIV